MSEEYELSSVVREHCDFWSRGITPRESDSSYYQILANQVCAQRGIILYHYEDIQHSGVVIAAFESGIRVYKTRGRGPYEVTTDIRWERLEQVQKFISRRT